MTIRKAFGKIHLWLGLASGLVVFIVAITGCLYVFEEEGRNIFQHKYLYVEPQAQPRKPLQELTKIVRSKFPADRIEQIRFKEETNAAIVYHTKSKKAISVNPYTGVVIGARNLKADFFSVILDIHLHLMMGKFGEQLVKWNVLIFFILCVSGLILWWPKQKRFFKKAVTINFKTKNWKRVNWDLHSVLGFYGLVVLLIIALTGMFWVFDSVKWTVSKITGAPITANPKTKSKPDAGANYTMEEAYYVAAQKYPGATQTFITNPSDSLAPVRVLFRYPYTIVRKQNTVFFDRYSGEILREDLYGNYTAYDKVSRSNYDFHTGRIRALGMGSKIIYFLASLFAASLPVTGTLIWLNRKRKKKPAVQKKSFVKSLSKQQHHIRSEEENAIPV